MKRRSFLASAAAPLIAQKRRPNVVFILTDDQRWDAMSCVENRFFPALRTPNMDRLAAEGARFTNCFVTNSLCSPSRACLLSGLYSRRHRVIDNYTDFPDRLPHYGKVLAKQGYDTAYIGKWHMGEQRDDPRPGFAHWVSHLGQGVYNGNEFNIDGKRQKVAGYYTDVVTEMAGGWLRRSRSSPFLLILGHKAVHSPFTPAARHANAFDTVKIGHPATAGNCCTQDGKPGWVEKRVPTRHGLRGNLYGLNEYDRFIRSYYGALLAVDESVGAICDTLRGMGELDNTLLILAADNGYMLGEHSLTDKRAMYEESIRIPMVMRYPSLIRPGALIPEMALNVDVAPTILDIAGAPPLPGIDGRSLKPLLTRRARSWRTSFDYEYFLEKVFPWTPHIEGVRTTRWKYIRYPDTRDTEELYDLRNDPGETRNLIRDPAHSGKLAELRKELARLRSSAPGSPQPHA